MKEIWLALVSVAILIGVLAYGVTTQAQQRPYTAYAVGGGCLYVTAQGYAVLRQIDATKEQLEAEKLCQ